MNEEPNYMDSMLCMHFSVCAFESERELSQEDQNRMLQSTIRRYSVIGNWPVLSKKADQKIRLDIAKLDSLIHYCARCLLLSYFTLLFPR